MTKEEWNELEHTLVTVGCHADLEIDGYKVHLMVVPYKSLTNVIYVDVNGKGLKRCTLEDCEERRRFCQPHKRSLLTADDKKRLKRERKAFREEVEKKATYYYYMPFWTSFRSMKSHFIKNNKSIELVNKIGEILC